MLLLNVNKNNHDNFVEAEVQTDKFMVKDRLACTDVSFQENANCTYDVKQSDGNESEAENHNDINNDNVPRTLKPDDCLFKHEIDDNKFSQPVCDGNDKSDNIFQGQIDDFYVSSRPPIPPSENYYYKSSKVYNHHSTIKSGKRHNNKNFNEFILKIISINDYPLFCNKSNKDEDISCYVEYNFPFISHIKGIILVFNFYLFLNY